MKNRLFLLPFCMVLSLCIAASVMGQEDQEILVGGNMEDESDWHIYDLDSEVNAEYEFNYTGDVPSEGSGGCLYIYCDGTVPSNTLIWQEVSLKPGATYEISGAFKDLTGGTLNQFWCEILLSQEVPVDTAGDYVGNLIVGITTYSGCGNNLDGTFEDDCCKGDSSWYTVPDTLDDPATFYFAINPGMWTGGDAMPYEIVVDEISLVGPPAASGIEENRSGIIDQFELHQNYPNPFNPVTQIHYSLKEEVNVTIRVYNLSGQLVTTLVNQKQPVGEYRTHWNGRNYQGNLVSNGVYIYKMQAGSFKQTNKMILIK